MFWTVQLTPWLLPFSLGVLIAVRDFGSLWPLRRETGSLALLALVTTSGVWALLHLTVVGSASLDAKLFMARMEYVPAVLAPLAWAWFGLAFSRRGSDMMSLPIFLLAALSFVTLWLALDPDLTSSLIATARLQETDAHVGLVVTPGFWHWLHISVRVAAILGGTAAMALYVLRAGVTGFRVATLTMAALAALVPTILHLGVIQTGVWLDMSSVGFVVASSVFGWGLLRDRLQGLGPVARNLVMEELRDPVVVLDGKGRIVDVNRAAEEVLDFHTYGDVPLPLGTLWASAREKGTEELARVDLPIEVDGARDEIELRTFEVTVTPLEGRGGTGRAALLLRDVTARDRMEQELLEAHQALTNANEELERLANTDSLTGLANRRHFMDVLSSEIDRAQRYDRDLSVILVDLDLFKKVNDSHGHQVGDQVLRVTADVLRSICRDQDLAGRLGGEEFALLLPETDREGARIAAERLRNRLEGKIHQAPEGDAFSVTGSMGVAWLQPGITEAGELLRMADGAMYEAKRKGRNRVCLAE